MHLIDSFWTSLTFVVGFFTFSPVQWPGSEEQAPLFTSSDAFRQGTLSGPVFKPPSGRLSGPGSDFVCDYSRMEGWSECSTPDNRGCWLRNNQTGAEYNISTDYENPNLTPNGTTRHYVLNIGDDWINADGLNFTQGKVFNGTYPGPWIQACWGDNVTVVVKNQLKNNGTSIHWHGIRQFLTTPMDGVNGVTQCPIAPEDSFSYTFRARQYGSSWYHSHYSVQYADGAAGPMTLHGPSSEPYDEAKLPLLMTDWGHNSAFEAIWTLKLKSPSILLNGIGNVTRYNNSFVAPLPVPSPYTINFDLPGQTRPRRYLLRLINTSFDTMFVFSIDNHLLQIVGADFVPIHSYMNTSVRIGIGQRYHVIVTANPSADGGPLPEDGNYWIRTWRAGCGGPVIPAPVPANTTYETSGILRYGSSQALPKTTAWKNIDLSCFDEAYTSLKPVVPWSVGQPPANDPSGGLGEKFNVQLKKEPSIFPLALFSIGGEDFRPLQIDYSRPTLLKLNYTGGWDPLSVVIPENYTDNDWVYMVLRGLNGTTTGAHPIHLHGHDFAILQQVGNATFPERLDLTRNNPPRRDVVLLPNNGYVVIAFKTDNPGTWLLHCHIAYHASNGLAMQILERQQAAAGIWPSLDTSPALQIVQTGCNKWNQWWGNCANWWPGDGTSCLEGDNEFSPDSGV